MRKILFKMDKLKTVDEEKTIDEKVEDKVLELKKTNLVEFYKTYTQLCFDRGSYDISEAAQIWKLIKIFEESTESELNSKCETALNVFLNVANSKGKLTMEDCFNIASAKDALDA